MIYKTEDDFLIIEGDTSRGSFRFKIDKEGKLIDYKFTVNPNSIRPPLQFDDVDIEVEKKRTKRGGCCGQPTE